MEYQTIDINKLVPNPENPRFEPVKGEQAAINLMVSEVGKDLVNLAEDIALHGFNPFKRLGVIKIGADKFRPVEGNRRVVAAKLLNNPTLVKDKKYQKKFQALHDKYKTQIPQGVDCAVSPDEETAARWVTLEHTGRNKGRGVLNWNSKQRQRFISRYSGKKPTRGIQIFDFADQHGLDHSKVDATTLGDRLLKNPAVREQIGIDFPGGLLNLKKTQGEVIKNLKKVFSAMSKSTFTVTQVYTAKQSKEWIDSILRPATKRPSAQKAALLPSEESLPFEIPVREPKSYSIEDTKKILRHIAVRFPLIARQMSKRYANRNTLVVEDEFDVQDLFHSILKLYFDDVRPEEWGPSHAGASSRIDILLKSDEVGVEIKMTRKGLQSDKQVGDQILVDIPRYRKYSSCKYLFCFVFDPKAHIGNPIGLSNDIRSESNSKMEIDMWISQGLR